VPRRLVVDLHAQAPVWRLSAEGAARLRGAAPAGWEVCIISADTVSDGDGGATPHDEVLTAVASAEAYVGFGLSRDLFLAAPALRWVHSAAAGVRSLLFPEMRASAVVLTNSAGVHAEPMAETVLGGVLYLLRGLDLAGARQRERRWDRAAFVGAETPMREVRDCRALIIGAGGIGSAIARRLTALGAECVGVRRHPDRGAPEGFARVVGPDAWEALLPESDLFILSAPATSETQALVGRAALERLPRRAIVVNVARGSLLDEGALADFVAAGRLRGAVLDVFETEPLPAESPLWGLSSVVITPHVSAVSPRGFWERELDLIIDNWHRYIAGAPMRNVVDKEAGY
jgi:phosphoglycerate dehydrogenase-like enzyme